MSRAQRLDIRSDTVCAELAEKKDDQKIANEREFVAIK